MQYWRTLIGIVLRERSYGYDPAICARITTLYERILIEQLNNGTHIDIDDRRLEASYNISQDLRTVYFLVAS